ncbi:TRAP transporter small permease [Polynucleobacter asymbioticus]|jgi:TRAP-type C4-dicarboxylate transport system permease small subunit|nr:TRAP transporter small permease [Polynucleobacter asymbioticus]APB98540.1 C4-dicarboxylate ABC transporter [Polynucleobacter asymbioticus]APC00825.1 C4-dicarboxylate ABC transporter [Polynucleobacter asymbioticus]APC05714.1 C4-dicarboxylate ABC transporter [Polynucleobacter asymbioticus]
MYAILEAADRMMSAVNKCLVLLGSVALMAAALILSYSVMSRGLFHAANDWQDEAALFCLVGVTFLCSSYVQEKRGHIGISAIEGLLPHPVNKVRGIVVDVISCLFFAFFSAKTWDLLHEAWVDGQVTNSTWAPSLWIPYSMMFTGMVLLTFQLFLQIFIRKAVAPDAVKGGH